MVNDAGHALWWEGGARVPDPRAEGWLGNAVDAKAVDATAVDLSAAAAPGTTSTASIRVVIVDSDETARAAALECFGSDHRIGQVHAVSTLGDLRDLPSNRSHVIVVDPFPATRTGATLGTAGSYGAALIEAILRLRSDARILVLTTVAEHEAVIATLRAGASGYVLKSLSRSDLIHAVLTVGGDTPAILDPTLLGRWFALIRSHAGVGRGVDERHACRRTEQGIAEGLGTGRAGAPFGAQAGMPSATVTRQLESLASKYGRWFRPGAW